MQTSARSRPSSPATDPVTEPQVHLEIRGPGGQRSEFVLSRERATIGRLPELNDVVLEPDPERYVTGKWHCLVEREASTWRVIDNGSANGTFLRRGGVMHEVREAEPLTDGDVICVLARLSEDAEPDYWEIVFHNPLETVRVAGGVVRARLEYDSVQAKLFRIVGPRREEIRELRPQVHRLLRYLVNRNRANNDVPVLCSHDELMEAIWQDEPLHTRVELNRLIHDLRQKVELDPKNPRFVQTERELGFRLDPRPPAE